MSNWLDRKAEAEKDNTPTAFIEGNDLYVQGTDVQINELESAIKQIGLYGDVTTDSVSGVRWFRIDIGRIPAGKVSNYIK
jgi:hypothetical protein